MVKGYLNQLSSKLDKSIACIESKNYDQAIMLLELNKELISLFVEKIVEIETEARFIEKINEIIEEPF